MAERKSFVDEKKVKKLNAKVYEKASLDREHLMEFLTYIDTNDALTIIRETQKWLEDLHANPKYSHIVFPKGDIDAVIGDLDSYGRVQPETILSFKESSSRTVPIS